MNEVRKVSFRDGKPALVDLNFTELVTKYTSASRHMYTLNSGATHLNPWLTRGIEGSYYLIVTAAVGPLLDLSDAVVDSVLGYAGGDPMKLHEATHRRRVALLRAQGNDNPVSNYIQYASALTSEAIADPSRRARQDRE